MLYRICFIILALAILVSCTNTKAPSCSGDDVKNTVIEISTGEIKNALLLPTIADFKVQESDIAGSVNVYPPKYEEWNKAKSTNETVNKVITAVDKRVAELKIALNNIRMNSKKDDIKKCECSGDLTLSNGKTIPITYNAQYTEDKKTYVEVFGLK